MSNLCLTLETFAGGSVEETIKDLARTAFRLELWIKCDVNGIEVLAAPNDSPNVLWANYEKARDRKAKFVSGNVIPRGEP